MIELVIPERKDLWFKRELLEDEDTMSYNARWGGAIGFPEERWDGWYGRWVACGDAERFYRYLYSPELGRFVGETAYHYDKDLDGYLADVIVHSRYRHRGFGGQGLRLLCQAARERGLTALYDDIAIDNPAVELFLANGFREVSRDAEKILLRREL